MFGVAEKALKLWKHANQATDTSTQQTDLDSVTRACPRASTEDSMEM